jgi:hypothetical protein
VSRPVGRAYVKAPAGYVVEHDVRAAGVEGVETHCDLYLSVDARVKPSSTMRLRYCGRCDRRRRGLPE